MTRLPRHLGPLALGLALLATAGCRAANDLPAPTGTVWIAGGGEIRALSPANLSSPRRIPLPGPVTDAVFDPGRNRVDLLLGGGANALETLPASPAGSASLLRLNLSPTALALDGSGKAFIVGSPGAAAAGRLQAIDLVRMRIVGQAPTARTPCAIALNAAKTRLIVVNAGDHSAQLFDPRSLRPLGRIPLAFAPRQLAALPFGDQAYVLGDDRVAVLDTRAAAVVTYLPVGPGARDMIAKPDGGEVYVSNSAGSVSVIDTSTNVVSGTMAAGLGAAPMAVAPDGSALYVGNAQAGTVSVINLADRSQLAVVRVGEHPARLALAADGLYLFVADTGSNDVAVVRSNRDGTNPNTLATLLPAPPQPGMLLSVPGGER